MIHQVLVYRLKAGILYRGLSDLNPLSALMQMFMASYLRNCIGERWTQEHEHHWLLQQQTQKRWNSWLYWETSQQGHISHYTLAGGKNSRLSQLLENAGRVATIAGTDLSARGSSVAQITGTDLSARGSLVDHHGTSRQKALLCSTQWIRSNLTSTVLETDCSWNLTGVGVLSVSCPYLQ